jgi:hypothetical protein
MIRNLRFAVCMAALAICPGPSFTAEASQKAEGLEKAVPPQKTGAPQKTKASQSAEVAQARVPTGTWVPGPPPRFCPTVACWSAVVRAPQG